MRKLGLVMSIALAASTGISGAHAATAVVEKKFANCTELNRTYPGGVSKSSKAVNQGGKTKKKPTVNAKVYAENSSKDRDRDGIACEK